MLINTGVINRKLLKMSQNPAMWVRLAGANTITHDIALISGELFVIFVQNCLMDKPKYIYQSEQSLMVFEFFSEGPKGRIKKMVQYSVTGTEDVYNLAFEDYDEETKKVNDVAITNNGDSPKVLATVASTVYAFTEKYPNAWIFATGSTEVRTRLYRMGISNNIEEIKEDFDVYGLTIENGVWVKFVIGDDYEAFLITKRK